MVFDLAGVEGIMHNASYRSYGEEPGASSEIPLGIGKLLGIPGLEALTVEPGSQLAKGRVPAAYLLNNS
jgi:hypothetical protein